MSLAKYREPLLFLLAVVFSVVMFIAGFSARSVDNYVCVTRLEQGGAPFFTLTQRFNTTCSPGRVDNFTCDLGDLLTVERGVVWGDGGVPQ